MSLPANGPATWDPHARTLHRVALAAARPASPELFDELVHEMAASLDAAVGLIAVFTDETCTRVRTISALLDGRVLAPFEYTLAGTPCEQVVGSEFRHVVRGVVEEFQASSLFARKGMDSYAAYPLCDSHGERLGLLAAMDRGPLTDVALAEAVLKILGSRIAAELERTTTEGVLKTAALAVSSARGDAVFAELARSLAAILHVDAAFIARPSANDPGTMFEAGGVEVAITTMEYELLRVFLANPNRVLSRDQLLMQTRNREWEPFDRSIDIRIGRLRRKIEPDPAAEPRCIRTVRNAGYMYVPA